MAASPSSKDSVNIAVGEAYELIGAYCKRREELILPLVVQAKAKEDVAGREERRAGSIAEKCNNVKKKQAVAK